MNPNIKITHFWYFKTIFPTLLTKVKVIKKNLGTLMNYAVGLKYANICISLVMHVL